MNSLNYDVYRSIAHEHNARILKASNDARLLRSLNKGDEIDPKAPSPKAFHPRLLNTLASLLIMLKRQLA
jgi:hypothetical protein